jgi:hypothetical protein
MKYCVKCGEQLKNKETVCPNCGCAAIDQKAIQKKACATNSPKIYCTKCGGTVHKKSIFCPFCGCFSVGKKTLKNPNDKISLGLCLVAFLMPLFGLIYWPLKHKELPEKAQAVGIMAVISATIFWAIANGVTLYY